MYIFLMKFLFFSYKINFFLRRFFSHLSLSLLTLIISFLLSSLHFSQFLSVIFFPQFLCSSSLHLLIHFFSFWHFFSSKIFLFSFFFLNFSFFFSFSHFSFLGETFDPAEGCGVLSRNRPLDILRSIFPTAEHDLRNRMDFLNHQFMELIKGYWPDTDYDSLFAKNFVEVQK